jgi:hypothetical protein
VHFYEGYSVITEFFVRYETLKRLASTLVTVALLIYVGLWIAGPNLAPESPRNGFVTSDSQSQLPVEETEALSTSSSQMVTQSQAHDHSAHSSNQDNDDSLPHELEQYVESQRIPSSEIPLVIHGNGNATAYTGNQWSTVVMAVIDDDGSHRTVERKVLPIGTLDIPTSKALASKTPTQEIK